MRRERRRAVDSRESVSDWEHVKLTLQETGGWIKNADSKTTILAAAFGVSLTFGIPQAIRGLDNFWLLTPRLIFIDVAMVTILLASILTTGYNIYRALVPSVRAQESRSASSNRFSWPDVARGGYGQVPPRRDNGTALADAWEQSVTLANIASRKYTHFARALKAFGVYLIALLAIVLTTAVLA